MTFDLEANEVEVKVLTSLASITEITGITGWPVAYKAGLLLIVPKIVLQYMWPALLDNGLLSLATGWLTG
jgi:hypothetical protein